MKESIDIEARLFELQDLQYHDFHARLIPTIVPQTIIGVRTPRLRKFAKEIAKTPQAAEFIKKLPHKYYDENNLHGFLLELVSHVTYDDYYVKMMIAWYFATALAKQYDIAIESFRLTRYPKCSSHRGHCIWQVMPVSSRSESIRFP